MAISTALSSSPTEPRDLQAALSPRSSPAPAARLFLACQAVTEAAGISLECPDPASADAGTVEGIARASAVRVRRFPLGDRWWRREGGPLLAYRGERPVALIPRKTGRYVVSDPASEVSEPVDAALAAEIGPDAYIFSASLPAGEIGPFRLLCFSLSGSRTDLLRALGCAAAAGALSLVTPVLTAWFAGSLLPAGDRGQLAVLVAALIVSAVCSALFNLTSSLALQRAGIRAGSRAMAAVWDRLLALPVRFFRQFNPADLAIRVLAIDRSREVLANSLTAGAITCLFSALNIVLLIRFAPALVLPALTIVSSIAAASAVCGWLTLQRQAEIAACEALTAGKALEAIQCIAKLRVAGAEHRAFAGWARSFAQGHRQSLRARGISGALAALQAAAPVSGWILVAALTASGNPAVARPAELLAFGAAFQQLLAGALQLSGLLLSWAGVAALMRRTQAILSAEPESRRFGMEPGHLNGQLELRDLTFRYDPAGPAVLDGISLRIEPGEFIALVGSSGSGKSTLLRLLLGFERPEKGSILYDGRDLSMLNLQAVRRQLGVVLQGGRILAGDIASNILSATGLGRDAAWKAAEAAGIASDIRTMPMGMHTQLMEDGAGLSGGQRQRLLIARALVHNPKLLFLDEATSAVDSRMQAAVTCGLEQLGVTRVVIAHRLSTVRHADRICVLERGRIAEVGTYDELMIRKGRFFALAARQNV